MRAALLSSPRDVAASPLDLRDLSGPAPGPGELLVEVRACAVCRTDLQLAEGDIPLRRRPVIPGHQAAGTVLAVGDGVEPARWQPGDPVGVAWLASACGHCPACTSGRENLCPAATFTGWDRDGGFAQRLTFDARFALPLPAAASFERVAPLLCGGIIGYRSLRISGIQPGGRLGLFGFGASASLAIQVAVHWGCEVFVWTRSAAEQQRARALGAAWAGAYADEPGAALDAAITFAPAGAVVVEALRRVAPGGTVAINAIHLDEVPAFPYDLLWQERSLRSVANFTRQDATEFLALAAAIPIETAVEVLPLGQANTALQRLKAGAVSGAFVLVP